MGCNPSPERGGSARSAGWGHPSIFHPTPPAPFPRPLSPLAGGGVIPPLKGEGPREARGGVTFQLCTHPTRRATRATLPAERGGIRSNRPPRPRRVGEVACEVLARDVAVVDRLDRPAVVFLDA